MNVKESTHNDYPIDFNLYKSMYDYKKFEYTKYKNNKHKLEKQLSDKIEKQNDNKMFCYN